MKLKTSRNKTYDVDWVDGPTITSGQVVLQMRDGRRLPTIAREFDGLTHMERESEAEGNKAFDGYSELESIYRRDGVVVVALGKPKE